MRYTKNPKVYSKLLGVKTDYLWLSLSALSDPGTDSKVRGVTKNFDEFTKLLIDDQVAS